MIPMPLSYIAEKLNGRLDGHDDTVDHVFTDSRIDSKDLVDKQALFVALKGPNFDAHKFVENIQGKGARAALVEKVQASEIPQIIVSDTRLALAKIAHLNRQKSRAKYIAVTGSSGKTTVKEMIASILSLSGKTLATKGNLNNDIGAPLTLLAVDQSIDYAVIELGANHVGEIAFTANLVQPDVALVNNVSAAHLQGFGDLQGVAKAKAEIYFSLLESGTAIVNADDEFSEFFSTQVSNKKIEYSISALSGLEEDKSNASCSASQVLTPRITATQISRQTDQSSSFVLNANGEQVQINLPLIGTHNVANALAAASCCFALDIPMQQIAKGLAQAPVVAGRLVVNELSNSCRVIDDTYNANLASMKAAIDLLGQYPVPRILVVGDMAELGDKSKQLHEEMGSYALKAGISKLFCCGPLSRFTEQGFVEKQASNSENTKNLVTKQTADHFAQKSELIIKLKKEAKAGTTILVKGSRSSKMENVVKALVEFSDESLSSGSNHALLGEAQ